MSVAKSPFPPWGGYFRVNFLTLRLFNGTPQVPFSFKNLPLFTPQFLVLNVRFKSG